MADPGLSSSRLEDLQMRWQQDPDSRIYLQLAEEYRKLERHPEAIEVLKRGLQKRPHDLSGQVALGRCHLEMEELDEAAEVLESVVARDPTHIVGNKLLLEARLESGDAAKAGERLDLYKLLNASDPEIGDLEQRLRGLRQTPKARPGVPEPAAVTTAEMPSLPEGMEAPPPPPAETASGPELEVEEVVEAPPAAVPEPPEPPAASQVGESPFETWPGGSLPGTEPRRPEAGSGAGTSRAAEASPASGPETVKREEPLAQPRRSAFDIFELGPPPPPPDLDALWRALAGETAAPSAVAAAPEPAEAFEELELAEPSAEPAPPGNGEEAPGEEPASATLGELYLRQGHLAEAERIFRQVLRRNPRNAVALAGLERIRGEESLTAHAVLASVAEEAPEGLTTKKIRLLEGYLQHLRRVAGEAHVR